MEVVRSPDWREMQNKTIVWLHRLALRQHVYGLAALAFILGFVYWRTLLPSMGTWGDPAKLQFLGKVLGTPHLTGTPLYILLNHLFVTTFPKGTLAFKANLLSACFSVLAVWFLFAALTTLELRPPVAFVTSLTFGLGYTVWSQSLMAEVYTLTTLFVAAVTCFLIKWNRTGQERYFLAACALYALSFGTHLIIVGLLPAFLYVTLATDRSVFRNPKLIGLVALFILVGILQYGYIVWRTNDPSTPYLESTTQGLLAFIRSPGSSAGNRFSLQEIFSTRIPMFLEFFWREYYLLIAVGVWGAFRVRDRTIGIFLALCILFSLFVAFIRFAREYEVYFLPTYVAFSICIAYGLDGFARAEMKKPGYAYVFLLIPALFLWANYEKVDHSQRTLHARIVEKVLTTVERDGVILAPNYDYAAFYWYYLIGEGYESRNLHALQVDYQNLDRIRAYLEGEGGLYIIPQRKFAPPGLRVFVMKETARELEKWGYELQETGTRYIYQVLLPGGK